jgi:hypothetical protein
LGLVTAFICNVTAVCASALPLITAPVFIAINVLHNTIPLKLAVVPRVVSPATCQKMFLALVKLKRRLNSIQSGDTILACNSPMASPLYARSALCQMGGQAVPTQFRSMNAQPLTPEGEKIAGDLARRHGFSVDAVTHMMYAVLNGNGSMAQFSHPEFGGSGQWMRSGMLMLGDMFNYGLKGRVDALCNDISGIFANQPGLLSSGSFQSQSQGGNARQTQATGAPQGQSSLFLPDPALNWWPQDLGAQRARDM